MGKRKRYVLTQERLHELLDYDPCTGTFRWRVTRGPAKAGSRAGCVTHHGYRVLMVLGRSYYEHRLAWFWVTGAWPTHEIDHKDGDGGNNRFENLREATHAQNLQNLQGISRRGGTSAFSGVSWSRVHDAWRAYIGVDGRFVHLGLFETEGDARDAYLKAKSELHTFQPTPRDA